MSETVRSYMDLKVYHIAIDLSAIIYRMTQNMPIEEKFSLRDQMRRAVVSISSNIAEGNCRGSTKEYIRFLYFAKGSNAEVHTQLLIGQAIGYFDPKQTEYAVNMCVSIGKMLSSLIAVLKEKDTREN